MPIITAFPDPVRSQVRVEINWSDIPSVQQAGVSRYNVETGECVPLRPYVCYDGWELVLSCGHGIFFDTEAPLDTEFYYITTSTQAPCVPNPPTVSVLDTYTRVLVDTWGQTNTFQPWDAFTGLANQYDVNGVEGTITPTATNVNTIITLAGPGPDYEAQVDLTTNVNPTGASLGAYGLVVRWVDDSNYVRLVANIDTAGVVNAFIVAVVGGVTSILANTLTAVNTASDIIAKASVVGDQIKFKLWNSGFPEPLFWTLEVTHTPNQTSRRVGVVVRRDTGNLTPTTVGFDNFTVTVDCAGCTPVTVDTSAAPTVLPSNGTFWLRDPVRPCNDRNVPLCFTPPNSLANADGAYCIPGSGIFFASMDTESYQPNTLTLAPNNAKFPLAMTRQRRGVSSVLQLVTRTFDDRDALLRLADPGSPLFWQGPANYGIPDQYMDIGTISVDRGLTDHRFQVRVFNLPYIRVGRPAGPSQGVCGSQVQDYCDMTWQELTDSGFTWDDLIRGRGNGEPVDSYRTWTVGPNTVLGDFADWNAVDDGTRTWTDLEVGT